MKKLGKYLDERSLPRLGVLLCFSAVFMLFASPYTTPLNAYYGYDSAVFMSFGKGITHGLRLYLDLYDNKGPMIFYFNALGYLLGGRTGLWILQVVFMTFAFELSYRTARLFTGRGTAWLSVLVLLFLYCGTVGEGNMTEEWGRSCFLCCRCGSRSGLSRPRSGVPASEMVQRDLRRLLRREFHDARDECRHRLRRAARIRCAALPGEKIRRAAAAHRARALRRGACHRAVRSVFCADRRVRPVYVCELPSQLPLRRRAAPPPRRRRTG